MYGLVQIFIRVIFLIRKTSFFLRQKDLLSSHSLLPLITLFTTYCNEREYYSKNYFFYKFSIDIMSGLDLFNYSFDSHIRRKLFFIVFQHLYFQFSYKFYLERFIKQSFVSPADYPSCLLRENNFFTTSPLILCVWTCTNFHQINFSYKKNFFFLRQKDLLSSHLLVPLITLLTIYCTEMRE